MDRLLRNESGWTIIETLITLPLLVFLIFAAVEYWCIFTIYQHAESIKYNALARMEVQGGLYPSDKQLLVERLIELGADPATIQIDGDVFEEGEPPVPWPEEVRLNIQFVPKHFDSFVVRTLIGGRPGDPIRIGVKGSAVSQKIVE